MAEIKKYLDNLAAQELVNQIKAEDSKVLQGAKDYADGLAKNYDAAGAAATAKTEAIAEAEKKVNALAEGQVKTNKDAIDTLNGNKDVVGSVDYKVEAAKTDLQTNIDDVDDKADANKEAIDAINNAESGILAQAKADATEKANAVQSNVDALAEKVGEIPESATATTVVEYIDEKTSGIASDATVQDLNDRVAQAEADIDTIQGDYLKGDDKTALENKITAEETRATGAESVLSGRIKAIEDDFLKAADKTELQDNITENAQAIAAVKEDVDAFFADADMTESAKDTLKELQEYIKSDETGAAAMSASIKNNADNITAVTGRVGVAEGKITTLEGEMDAVEGAVAAKAEAQALADEIKARTDADTALDGRLQTVEGLVGEGGSVDEKIATAKQGAIDAAATDATTKANQALADAKKYADEEDAKIESRVDALEADTHTHANKEELDKFAVGDKAKLDDASAKTHEHANKTVIDGITAEKVVAWDVAEQNAKEHANGLNTAMSTRVDGIEDKVDANEEVIATKAAQADLTEAVERITTAESGIAANKAAIESFVAVTPAEIIAMFAVAE